MPEFSASVTYPTARVTETQPLEIRVIQEEYKHDIAVVRVLGSARKPYYRAGVPVNVNWSVARDRASFQGFVHHVEQRDGGLEIWCKGASTRFDNGLQTTYRYRTATSVASEIARALNFDLEITPHGRVFDELTATGGRTWEFLLDLAKEIGYSLYAKNTRLMMHPRTLLTARYANQAPVFRQGNLGNLGPSGERGTLHTFEPVDGAAVPGSFHHDNIFTGIDRRTGRPFRVVGKPANGTLSKKQYSSTGRTFHNLNVSTPEEARWKATAMAERQRFNSRAMALVEGNPRVHQTWPVLLGGDLDTQYRGAWFVHRAVHRLVPREYTLELELGRDAHGPGADIPDPRARRIVATRDAPGGKPKSAYPTTVLINGQWRAQWSSGRR